MISPLFLNIASCLFFVSDLQAQPGCRDGTFYVSIQPAEAVFTVAHAGYRPPGQAHFSIGWKALGATAGRKALAGMGIKLCAINTNNLQLAMTKETGIDYREDIGTPLSIKHRASVKAK